MRRSCATQRSVRYRRAYWDIPWPSTRPPDTQALAPWLSEAPRSPSPWPCERAGRGPSSRMRFAVPSACPGPSPPPAERWSRACCGSRGFVGWSERCTCWRRCAMSACPAPRTPRRRVALVTQRERGLKRRGLDVGAGIPGRSHHPTRTRVETPAKCGGPLRSGGSLSSAHESAD